MPTFNTTYNPNDPRPNWTVPRKLEVGMKVVVKLGPKHRQYSRLESFAQGKYLKGVVEWIAPETESPAMEIRINCINFRWVKGGGENFYVIVEPATKDCYNYVDAIVIRRVEK